MGFPGGSVVKKKKSSYKVGDLSSIPGLGRSSGEGNGNPLKYSCLKNPRDRGVWWAKINVVAESDTTSVTAQQQQQLFTVITLFSCLFIQQIY